MIETADYRQTCCCNYDAEAERIPHYAFHLHLLQRLGKHKVISALFETGFLRSHYKGFAGYAWR